MTSTDFGFRQVRIEDKARRVAQVFESVAGRYDLMNDLMSFGLHRLWKRYTIALAAVRPGQRILDVASGTGDLSALLAERVGPRGLVVASDVNSAMLRVGRDRLIDRGLAGNLVYMLADAEQLPFADGGFDTVTIAFGLRNVTRKERALAAMCGVLRPGGQLLVLEFSRLVLPMLQRCYDLYSLNVIPWIGHRVTGDRASYDYLVESIRRHPDQETLAAMMRTAGFDAVDHYNLAAGAVAVHRGRKL
ncbi:MAG: bifunctional demethylmenaquinone methyltransferase/2-methoxy-6-polyprenyl-1,4-benzoquinol methylase UbiE [Gammaproteobacteria bacterium]